MTLSNYFQKTFSEMVTEETIKYMQNGYTIKPGDSSMGFEFRTELTKFEDTYIRISVNSTYTRDYFNVRKVTLKVEELEDGYSFSNEKTKVLKEENFYIYEDDNAKKIFTFEEIVENDKIASKRRYTKFLTKRAENTWEKTPNKKVNIRGFKSADPKNIRIKRGFNHYFIENVETGKTKKFSM